MNNKEVIEYVKNNSKNPHAALIVEQLLTGCEVEYLLSNGEWEPILRPIWSPKTEYRLVKPKPAYRVFRLLGRTTSTVERFPDGSYSPNYNENFEWLSDWIEYDPEPTPKWPNEYIKRIAEIDEFAAQWLVDNGHINGTVANMFTWSESPQGLNYWVNIYQTLNASKLASS